MAVVEFQDPLALLREIERRARAAAVGLPQQEEPRAQWSGIVFRLGEQDLLAPLGEVIEILTMGEFTLTRVPGTKQWVRGIANVRGNLLPVMDLGGFLYGRMQPVPRQARVLVIQHEGLFVGLMVDAVRGLKHFFEEDRLASPPELDSALVPYAAGAFRSEEGTLPIFSTHKLAETPLFIQVAV